MNRRVVDRLASDIAPDLLECLRTQVNTFVKWDLVNFFHRNPYTIDTTDGIARHIGRNARAIGDDLAALADGGILVAHNYDGLTAYSYSDDADVRNRMQRLVEASNDRLFRTQAAFQVIRAMRAAESSAALDVGTAIGHGDE